MLFSLLAIAIAIPQAHAFDHSHAAFSKVLSGAVEAGRVDYALIKTREAALDGYVESFAAADIQTFDTNESLAFWINAYNAITISVIVDAMPVQSIRDIDEGGVWDSRTFSLGGEQLTLNQIGHHKLHPAKDPRIHAAINCASNGCPPLPSDVFKAQTIDPQLDAATKAWITTNAYTATNSKLTLSQIFEWYGTDFATANKGDIPGVEGPAEAALWFISHHVDPATAKRLTTTTWEATFIEYDWGLNTK